MNYKIREAQVQKVPYMFVVGAKESADPDIELVSVRHRHAGDLGSARPLSVWIEKIVRLSSERAVSEGEVPIAPPPGDKGRKQVVSGGVR
jgi:threonyl-tRNA synthetase